MIPSYEQECEAWDEGYYFRLVNKPARASYKQQALIDRFFAGYYQAGQDITIALEVPHLRAMRLNDINRNLRKYNKIAELGLVIKDMGS